MIKIRLKKFTISFVSLSLIGTSAQSFGNESIPNNDFIKEGAIHAQMHPNSPSDQCQVDVIEIGKNENGKFIPYVGLLRDFARSDVDPGSPKIRKIFSYEMKYKRHFENVRILDRRNNGQIDFDYREVPGPPPEIIGLADQRKTSSKNLAWDVFNFFARMFGILSTPVIVVDHLIETYRNNRHYYRTRALYSLRLLMEQQDSNLFDYVTRKEVQNIYGAGLHYDWKGVLVTENFNNLSYLYDKEDRESLADSNMARLVNILNREGLYAYPLNRDFVLVFYAPNKKYSRDYSSLYVDLNLPNTLKADDGSDLVLLGGYGISQEDRQLSIVDSGDAQKHKDRSTLQFLTDLGVTSSAIFLPAPFNLAIMAGSAGAEFILKKKGEPVLTSLLQTEAEFMALLNSGLAEIDPSVLSHLQDTVDRQNLKAMKVSESAMAENRKENGEKMSAYLESRVDDLCKTIDSERNDEFMRDYLDFGDRMKWRWNMFARNFNSDIDDFMDGQVRKVMKAKGKLVAARKKLSAFDESRWDESISTLVYNIMIVGIYSQPEDVELLSGFILNSVNPQIELTAIKAATHHRHGDLADPLFRKISSFAHYPGVMRDNPALTESYISLMNLNYNSYYAQKTLEKILDFVDENKHIVDADEREIMENVEIGLQRKVDTSYIYNTDSQGDQ